MLFYKAAMYKTGKGLPTSQSKHSWMFTAMTVLLSKAMLTKIIWVKVNPAVVKLRQINSAKTKILHKDYEISFWNMIIFI